METTPARASTASKTTPKDFFLWAGALVALYGSITSFIALLFEYINHVFPDALAGYSDPYGSSARVSMAALIVLTPLALVILRVIRGTISKEPGKAFIWVRRWALVLTLFIAGFSIAVDLITLINTFLGGELTTRFLLKVAVVLLVAAGVFMHFLADLKGYWIEFPKRAASIGIGIGVLAIASIAAGFLIIGTPQDIRLMRYDEQKVNDLQGIQYQIVNYYQQKQALPKTLVDLADPISSFIVPMDPQNGSAYRYAVKSSTSFELCATFNRPTPDTKGRGAYPAQDISYPSGTGVDENWHHETGDACFTRTIDPQRYPPITNPVKPI